MIDEARLRAAYEADPYCGEADVLALLDELGALRAKVADYEHSISWHTTCSNCAHLLDSCYAETCRAEKAEAKVARVEAVVHRLADDDPAYDTSHGADGILVLLADLHIALEGR